MARPLTRIVCTDPEKALDLRRQHGDCEVIADPCDCSHAPFCRWLQGDALRSDGQVRAALYDAVETLQRTRHAFQSRDLGQLRQRLERLLDDLSARTE
jgi:hypothetical protein